MEDNTDATKIEEMRVDEDESVGEKDDHHSDSCMSYAYDDRASIEDLNSAARENDVEKFRLLLKMGVVGISDCYAALDEAALYGN